MKVLILYFSGVGNTKLVAEKIAGSLTGYCTTDAASIEKISDDISSHISNYDAMVIGFPTFHASPAKPIMDFVSRLCQIKKPIPTFLFTTCGLYSANALRIFAKESIKKNICPIYSKSYRCAATDGILLTPFMNIWFRHEKNLDSKIIKDCRSFINLLNSTYKITLPPFKLYSILNFPNKLLGHHYSPTIHIHKKSCILCGRCISSCPESSICKGENGYPVVQKDRCIHCYRCIHHCPKKALSLSSKRTPSKTLTSC